RGKTGIIALWIPDQISTHYSHVARELTRLAKKAGREVIVSEVGNAAAEQILSHVPVDGIFAVDAPDAARAHAQSVMAKSVPVISIGVNCYAKADSVEVDLLAGTQQMMRHLIES